MCNVRALATILGILTGWACASAAAESSGPVVPQSAHAAVLTRRVVKAFDFNERPLGNLEELPMHWEKVTATGFPHYVNGELDETEGRPAPCFRLTLDGGNLGYRYIAQKIPAFPGSDHKIIAYVKTVGLRHARGYLEAFYMDRFGNVLGQTTRFSEVIEPATSSDPTWRHVEIELPFVNPDGRYIGLGIFLVQEDRLPAGLAAAGASFRKDVTATMYVDDVAVLRLPRCRLKLSGDKTLYTTGEKIVLQGTVADPVPQDLAAAITLEDVATGQRVTFAHPVRTLPPLLEILRGEQQLPLFTDHTLEPLPSGTYRAFLHVLSRNEVIITRRSQFAVVEPLRPTRGRAEGRFGIDLSARRGRDVDQLTTFLKRLGASWAIVPIWQSQTRINSDQFGQSLGDLTAIQLNRAGITVVGAYMATPEDLVPKTGLLNPSIWDLFSLDRDRWGSELALVLSRHADRIDHWMLGRQSNCWDAPYPYMNKVLAELDREFGQFQGQFQLMPAWPAMVTPRRNTGADAYVTWLPTELVWQGYEDYFAMWSALHDRLWTVMPRPELDRFERDAALLDFCRRVITAKRLGCDRIGVSELWSAKASPEGTTLEPAIEFAVYANLIRRLAGLTYAGQVRITDDLNGWLFADTRRAVLVLLRHKDGTLSSRVTLGRDLSAYDMWGRDLPLTVRDDGWALNFKRLAFVEGIDPDLARFVASVRFEPPVLTSRMGWHRLQLVFDNPFAQSISGQVRVVMGQNWRFDPPGGRFAVTGGRAFALPMKVRYPSNEPIGTKMVSARFTLEARRQVRLNLLVPLELSLPDLKMRVWSYQRHGRLIVSQEIRNTGREWADLRAYLIAPDRPRMERMIRRLGPGQTAIKEYVVGPWQELFGRSVRVGFRDVRGNRLVNRLIKLE